MKDENTKKIKPRYPLDILEDYCWIVGLSLIVGGILLLNKDPITLILVGLIIACIGAFLKGGKQK